MRHKLNAVSLKESSHITRELRTPLPIDVQEEYENGAYGQYDSKTLFYDIFLSPNSGCVVAIGPPLLNLKSELLPLEIKVNNQVITFSIDVNYKKLLVLKAKLKMPLSTPCKAVLKLNNGDEVDVDLHRPEAVIGDTLVTLQKNNEIRWIKDWIKYYRSHLGIKNFFIYDNNSENQSELIEALEGDATIVPWAFPHGVSYYHSNQFCQIGALNHFKLKYGERSIIYNFDIDELLICKNDLIKEQIQKGESLRFNNYLVPYLPVDKEMYSFSDFIMREKKPKNSAFKYTVHGTDKGLMNVHYFKKEKNILDKLLLKKKSYGRLVDIEDAYFLHYRGITTNWRTHHSDRLKDIKIDASNLVKDTSIVEVFEQSAEN